MPTGPKRHSKQAHASVIPNEVDVEASALDKVDAWETAFDEVAASVLLTPDEVDTGAVLSLNEDDAWEALALDEIDARVELTTALEEDEA